MEKKIRKRYPRKGTVIEKLTYLDENKFKTIWRIDQVKKELLKRKEFDLLKNLKTILNELSDNGTLFKISLRKKPLDTYYTFRVKWELDGEIPIGLISKPPHKDFLKLLPKCRRWHIDFSLPPNSFVCKPFWSSRCMFVEDDGKTEMMIWG